MSSSLVGSTTLKSSITPVIIYFLQYKQFLPGQCVIICSPDSSIHLRIFKTNHPIIHFNITSLSSRFPRRVSQEVLIPNFFTHTSPLLAQPYVKSFEDYQISLRYCSLGFAYESYTMYSFEILIYVSLKGN